MDFTELFLLFCFISLDVKSFSLELHNYKLSNL